MAPQSRPSLAGQLDREVHQIVLKILGENENENKVLRSSDVYDYIKNSNSSLARRPRKLLEQSIERALRVVQADVESDNVTVDDDMIPEESVDANTMNRHITAQWSKSLKQASSIVPETTLGSNIESTPTTIPKSKKRTTNGEPPRKRLRTISHEPPSGKGLADLGGMGSVTAELTRRVARALLQPDRLRRRNRPPPRGILLHGPSGCGKTAVVNAYAALLQVPFITISAPSIISGVIGDTEQTLREHFEEAKRLAPSLIFIDEIDAIACRREHTQRDTGRLISQLRVCMDDLTLDKTDGRPVVVIAATNNPDSLDPALRGTRFGSEISIGIPTEPVREKILRALAKQLDCAGDIDFARLAQKTPGFVGADLQELVEVAYSISEEAALQALGEKGKGITMELDENGLEPESMWTFRVVEALRLPSDDILEAKVTNSDFFKALPKIQPAIKREGFATMPNTTWADIGALDQLRKDLSTAITKPILEPEKYARVGITAPSGVLLWGPPGCGKTLLAKAVANEGRANFISIKGPELLNKYVGESERAVRQVFSRARASVPCIIFFDEIDALAATRDDSGGGGGSGVRIVNTLLTELDGLDDRQGIYVIAATNRPDMIDRALLRPGRLEKHLLVGLPGPDERVTILRTLLRGYNVDFNETIQKVAFKDCEGFSGADLASLARKAGELSIERGGDSMQPEDFVLAKESVRPSITDIDKYQLKMGL